MILCLYLHFDFKELPPSKSKGKKLVKRKCTNPVLSMFVFLIKHAQPHHQSSIFLGHCIMIKRVFSAITDIFSLYFFRSSQGLVIRRVLCNIALIVLILKIDFVNPEALLI